LQSSFLKMFLEHSHQTP